MLPDNGEEASEAKAGGETLALTRGVGRELRVIGGATEVVGV